MSSLAMLLQSTPIIRGALGSGHESHSACLVADYRLPRAVVADASQPVVVAREQ
jgi:hypothetical protein